MCRLSVLALILFYEQTVFSATLDQRQTGDLNVQIDLKNLEIVGLMRGKEEYVDYDYAYDYSEMTIKPPNGTTTKKPLKVTKPAISDKDNTTVASTVTPELDQTTSSIASNLTEASSTELNEPSTASPLTQDLLGSVNATTLSQGSNVSDSTATPLMQGLAGSSNTTNPDCKKGFFRNTKGNCELKLLNQTNALLKMIKQKSKLNMSNGVRQP